MYSFLLGQCLQFNVSHFTVCYTLYKILNLNFITEDFKFCTIQNPYILIHIRKLDYIDIFDV